MSTRCNIHFCYSEGKTSANIYRHCDGYPDTDNGVIADLAKFFAEVSELSDTRFSDASYLAAKFVVWQADQNARGADKLDFVSLGICSADAGDGEYVYEVICDGDWKSPGPPRVRWRPADGSDWQTP